MNWLLLQNSLLVAGATSIFAGGLGLIAALALASIPARWRRLAMVCAVLPLVLPPFLVVNCWIYFLGHNGVWRSWVPWNIFSMAGTVWILTLMLWPIPFFCLQAAWRKLATPHFEAEPQLTGFKLLRWLLIPAAKNELLLAMAVTFVLALNNFSVPAILQVKVLPAELWVSFNTTFDYATAAKLCWPLVFLPVALLAFARTRRVSWSRFGSVVEPEIFRRQLGSPLVSIGLGVFLALSVLSSALPLAQVVFSSETWRDFLPAIHAGQKAARDSFIFSSLSGTLILLVALTAWQRASFSFLWLAFLIPGVLLGIALIWLLNRPALSGFYQGTGIVLAAFLIRYFAIGRSLAAHAMNSADRQLVDAAKMAGAKGWTLIRHGWLPQMLPQLLVAWYGAFLFCLWDVETLIFIIPPGRETLPLRIFNLLHYGHNSQVNALCLVLLLMALFPLMVYLLMSKMKRLGWFPKGLNLGLLMAGLVFLAGCGQRENPQRERLFPVQSALFSGVEIIGSRGTGSGQFNKPRTLTVDNEDNLYVADMTGRVQMFSADGKFVAVWQMPQTDKGRPKGMGVDAEGRIIVIEPHYSRVNHFSPDGALLMQWGEHGTNDGQLAFPRAVAVNSRGEMLLSEFGITERVQRFAAKGEFLSAFGKPGSGASEFNRAEGLTIGEGDVLFVADSCNHRVQVFSPEGNFLRAIGKAGTQAGELSYPYDVRVDQDGLLFVCEFGNSRIQIFDAEDRTVELLGSPGALPGQLSNPWSIALDSLGNLYVADSQNHRVQKFIRKQHRASLEVRRK